MFETTTPHEDHERMMFEHKVFAKDARNVIASEGTARIERAETYKQWQAWNLRAGFSHLPLNPNIVKVIIIELSTFEPSHVLHSQLPGLFHAPPISLPHLQQPMHLVLGHQIPVVLPDKPSLMPYILRLEFAHYDYRSLGTILANDFALSMVASADMKSINKFLDRRDNQRTRP
ncbi:hypothetical protein RJ639_021216 [Escallonia herrerae]|uniref:Uncharacterized protein n=1 Tax=Escallonia herrerae TaxID=1293975 RepID=A0AA88V5M1_9ASTE|nr:hypothetical protein RJ639_021216 [Escallonia herrerae]